MNSALVWAQLLLFLMVLALYPSHVSCQPSPPTNSGSGGNFTSFVSNPIYQDMRDMPPLPHCTRGLSLDQSSLLDTQAKLDAVESKLGRDKLRTFQELRHHHTIDLSILDMKTLNRALVQLTDVMPPEDRDMFIYSDTLMASANITTPQDMMAKLELWIPEVQLLKTGPALQDMMVHLPEMALPFVCDHWLKEDTSLLEVIFMDNKTPDCSTYFLLNSWNRNYTAVFNGPKGRVLAGRMRQMMKIGPVTATMLTLIPGAVQPEDIDNLQHLDIADPLLVEQLEDPKVMEGFSKDVIKRLAYKIRDAHHNMSMTFPIRRGFLKKYALFLTPKELGMDPYEILDNDIPLEAIATLDPEVVEGFFIPLAWELVSMLSENNTGPLYTNGNMTAMVFCILANYAPVPDIFRRVFTPDNIEAIVPMCIERMHTRPDDLGFLFEIVMEHHDFDAVMMQKHAYILSNAPLQILANLTSQSIIDFWRAKQGPVSISLARLFWEKANHYFTIKSMDSAQLDLLRDGILALTPDELDLMPLQFFGQAYSQLLPYLDESCEQVPRTCEVIWNKVVQATDRLGIPMLDVLAEVSELFMKDFVSADVMHLIALTHYPVLDALAELPLTPSHAAVLIDRILERNNNESIVDDPVLGKMPSVRKLLSLSSNIESVQTLPDNEEILPVLTDFVEDIDSMSNIKIKTIMGKISHIFGLERGVDICFDDFLVEDVAPFFIEASEDTFNRLDTETKRKVLKWIGNDPSVVKKMRRPRLRRMFETQMEISNTDTGRPLSVHDVEETGKYLWCGMTEDAVNQLAGDVVVDYMEVFKSCDQLESSIKSRIVHTYMSENSPDRRHPNVTAVMLSPEKMLSLGSMVLYASITDDDLKDLPQEKMGWADVFMTDLMEQATEYADRMEEKSSVEITEDEKMNIRMLINNVVMEMFTMKKQTDPAKTAFTCQELRSFPGDLSFLNGSDIAAMDMFEFKECLQNFQESNWTETQLKEIGHRLKEAFGQSTGNWTEDFTILAGPLIKGLERDDLLQISFTKNNMAVIGRFELDANTSSEIVHKYMDSQGFYDLSTLSSDELISMGKLVCGIEEDLMDTLSPQSVRNASQDLAKATCLGKEQVNKLGQKLEETIGSDFSYILPEEVEEMGLLLGGFSERALLSLQEKHLANVDPRAFEKMDARTFANAFNASRLEKLSDEQAMYLTSEHIWRMSPEQRQTMENFTKEAGFDVPKASHGDKMSDRQDVQEVQALPRASCGSGLAFGGQADKLLNTQQKRHDYVATLSQDYREFFERLDSSPDHDVSIFTAVEMDMTLDYLMSSLDENGRNDYLDILNNYQYIPPDMLKQMITEWPPKIHLLQTDHVLCGLLNEMDKDTLGRFCLRISQDDVSALTTNEVIERCPHCVSLGYLDREADEVRFLLDEAKGSVYFRKLRQWKPDNWDLMVLVISPRAFKSSDVDRIRDNIFRNNTQLMYLGDERVFCCLSIPVKRKIMTRLRSVLGPVSQWSSYQVHLFAPYIPYMTSSDLEATFTLDFVINYMHIFEMVKAENHVENKALVTAAWSVAEGMLSAQRPPSTDDRMRVLCLIVKYAPRDEVLDTLYTPDELIDGLRNCSHWNISKENAGKVMKRIFNSGSFAWDTATLDIVADFPGVLTPKAFETINMTVLEGNWTKLKEKHLSLPVLRAAWDKFKPSYTVSSLTCDDIMDMGRMIFALPLRDLDTVPDFALRNCSAYIDSITGDMCYENPNVCKKIWEKIKMSASVRGEPYGQIMGEMGTQFIKHIPSNEFRNIGLEDLGGLDMLEYLPLNPAQAEVVMEMVEQELGPISPDNLNYTGPQVEKMANMFFTGASMESLQNLPEDTDLMDVLPHVMDSLDSMSEQKREVIYEKLNNIFGMDFGQDVCLDESTVKQSAGFFTQASKEDLNKLSPDTRKTMLKEIGSQKNLVKTMSRHNIREQFTTMKETENWSNTRAITPDDIDEYGPFLFCGMEPGDLSRMTNTALVDNLADLESCEQLDTATRDAMAAKVLNVAGGLEGLAEKPQLLESMGSLLTNVDFSGAATLSPASKKRIGSMVTEVMTTSKERVERLDKRGSSDVSETEKTEEKLRQKKMAKSLWNIVSDNVDCQTIQGFQGDLDFLSINDIAGMDPAVVTECMDEFQKTTWDLEQLRGFARKMKEDLGNDTSSWNKADIMRAGQLVAGLEKEDLGKITFDLDLVEVLGQVEMDDPKAMLEKYKEDTGMTDMSTVDADTLRTMGKMVCGMSSRDMADLRVDVVVATISEFADETCMDKTQVQEMGKKLIDGIPPNLWSEVSVEEMGIFVGGLSTNELNLMNEDQLSAIVPEAIALMSEDTFVVAFPAERMSQLSEDQVSRVSPKTLKKMDISQLIAIENIQLGVKGVNASNEWRTREAQFTIELPPDTSVKDLPTFQEVRDLNSSATCMSGMFFDGQTEDLLDTQAKRDAFSDSLYPQARNFFRDLENSIDHDVTLFSQFEMRLALDFLMGNLDQQGKNIYLDLKNSFGTLTKQQVNEIMMTWPPRLHLIMKPQLMCTTLGAMDKEVLNNFCKRLTENDVSTATMIELLNRCGDCLAVAHAERASYEVLGMMGGYKGKAFYEKLRQWKPRNWDIYHLSFAPDALEPEDITKVASIHFIDIMQIYRLGDFNFYSRLTEKVIQKLAFRLYTEMGALEDWTFLQQSLLLPYIVNMPPRVLRQELTASMVIAALPYYNDVLDVANEKFLQIAAWKVTTYLMENSDTVPTYMKQEAVCLVLQYSTHKKLWLQVYSNSDLLRYLPQCIAFGMDKKRIREAVRSIVSSSDFTWDLEGLVQLGPFLDALPPSFFENVNGTFLSDHWDQISNSEFTKPTLRMLWDRMKGSVDLSAMNCTDIQSLGRTFVTLTVNELEQFNQDALGECIGFIGRMMEVSCAENKRLCKSLWNKVKSYVSRQGMGLGEVVTELGPGFLKYLPRADIELIELADLGGVDAVSNLQINPEHAPIVMRKVAAVKGAISFNNTNYTAAAVEQIGPVFYHGATGSEFETLPEDTSLFEMLPHMAMHFDSLNEKKIEIVYAKLRKILGIVGGSGICLDTALAEQIAMFFSASTGADMGAFSNETRKVILKTLGKKYEYVKRMSRVRIQEMFKVMMELDNLSTKTSYTDDDISEYGYLWCGQSAIEAAKLSEEAVDGLMATFKECSHFESTTRAALVSRSIEVSGNLTSLLQDNPQRLEDLGPLLLDIDISSINTLGQTAIEVFVSSTQKLMKSLTAVQDEAKTRPSRDVSDTEKAEDLTKLSSLGGILFNIHLDISFSRRRRRRRALASADCATIESFNGALSFLTASDILSLSTSEFTDCLDQFQTTDWTSTQLEAFATQLEASFGSDTSTWSKINVEDAGRLLESLNSTQILALTVLTDDTISTLSVYIYYINAENIITAYLNTQGITDMATINATTLGNTGNLVCGFTAAQMAAMDPAVIDAASADLSAVSCLSSDQLTTLANKIVEVQGTDWTAVTTDTISSLGVLVGGLPESVLQDFGSDQIASISTTAISNIDATTFANVFTLDKIGYLSSSQANSLTVTQLNSLSADQLAAVTYVATTTSDSNSGDNGSSSIGISPLVLIVLVITSLMSAAKHL